MNSDNSYKKNNKGFYAVLSIALVAVVASTVVITYTSGKIKNKKATTSQPEIVITDTPIVSENANTPKEDVPDTRESTTEGTTKEKVTEKVTETTAETTVETTKENVSCVLPVGTQILKDYSNGTPVKSKTMNDWRLHNGVDFSGELGDEVHAVCDGKVTRVSEDSMWGKTVEIDHGNGMVAKYCGFDEISIKENDEVKKEQAIGTLGSIPIESADNTHLHLEITLNGKTTDPIAALGKENGNE